MELRLKLGSASSPVVDFLSNKDRAEVLNHRLDSPPSFAGIPISIRLSSISFMCFWACSPISSIYSLAVMRRSHLASSKCSSSSASFVLYSFSIWSLTAVLTTSSTCGMMRCSIISSTYRSRRSIISFSAKLVFSNSDGNSQSTWSSVASRCWCPDRTNSSRTRSLERPRSSFSSRARVPRFEQGEKARVK